MEVLRFIDFAFSTVNGEDAVSAKACRMAEIGLPEGE